jgi:hypothetical protein
MNLYEKDFNPVLYGKRETIKRFVDDAISYFSTKRYVPTIEQIEDYVTSDRWARSNMSDGIVGDAKPGFEYISLDDLCTNIQNLCSFNLDDVYESSGVKKMKLRIKEDFDDTIRINNKLRQKLNRIAQKYSKWLYPKELRRFYDEISELGVTVPAWSYDEDDRPHKYLLDGKEVTNSLCVFQTYEGDNGRNEYNIYFS